MEAMDVAETAECPTCTCGLCRYDPERRCWYNASGNPDWHDIWPGNYCPRCGDLLGDGTTTPPATPEQLRDAEAMAALRAIMEAAGEDGVRLEVWQWANSADLECYINSGRRFGLAGRRADQHIQDLAAAILLAAERLQADKEGETHE